MVNRQLTTIAALCFLITGIVWNGSVFGQSDKEIITNVWMLEALQEFDAQFAPKEKQKNDKLILQNDQQFTAVWNGTSLEGEWALTGNNSWLVLTPEGDHAKLKCKMIHLEADSLVFEHQNPETLVRTHYIYEPKSQ